MPALNALLKDELERLSKAHLKREMRETARGEGAIVMRGGKQLVSFSGNDYFGLSEHPVVKEAAKRAIDEHGVGAGASRLVTGNHPLYRELETILATMKKQEAACVFGSGYLANLGTISALVGEGDLVLADKFIHACMIDGVKLSGAKLLRFAHNDVAHAKELLEKHRGEYKRCLLMTETVFSMDGDRAPLADLAKLAKAHDAWLMADDAHGLGLVDAYPVDICMGTLSKGAGTYGGYVAASKEIIDYLHNTARSLIYSTALPPMVVAASIASLNLLQKETELRARPLQLARRFTQKLKLPEAQSAVVPLILGDNEKALRAAKALEEQGFLVAAIRPPTVPAGTARLRFAFSALHQEEQVDRVADIIQESAWLKS